MNERIMIVDDEQTMLAMVSRLLRGEGYDVQTYENPVSALEASAKFGGENTVAHEDSAEASEPPDLILLDVMMPGMDGLELCRRLKSRSALQDIPVIFLTGRDDATDKKSGLEAGGVDYITKPFDAVELLARVRVHISLHESRKANRRYAQQMEALAEERAEQLVHADRMATVGTLAAGVAHEINNPTAVIRGNGQMLARLWPVLEAELREAVASGSERADRIQFALDEMPGILDGMLSGTDRIKRITGGLLSYSRQQPTRKEPVRLAAIVEQAMELCRNALKYHVRVEQNFPDDLPAVRGDGQKLEQVFINLFTNAAHATKGRDGALLEITGSSDETNVVIRIRDNGSGMSPETVKAMWKPFFTTKTVGKGTGLGMSIIKGIIEDHHGDIEVESTTEMGTEFTITLPAATSGNTMDSCLATRAADIETAD